MKDPGQSTGEQPVMRRLRHDALWQVGWHWMGTLAVCGGLGFVSHPGVAAAWLVPAAGVLAYVHRQLWRHLQLNRATDRSDLYPHLGLANAITVCRGWGISVLAGFFFLPFILPAKTATGLAWVASGLYLMICVADALDGLWARYTRTESLFGQKLDTKMDALGILAASTVAVSLNHLPSFYVLAGLSYYGFQWGIGCRKKHGRPVRPLSSRPFRRIMSGMTMGFLVAALLPLFPAALLKLAAFYFMLPLVLGFAWDWLDVTGRLTDTFTARLLPLLTSLTTIAPVIIRTGLLLCGIPITRSLLDHWPAAVLPWTVLWAMMVSGWMGRSAAVGASCLLGITAERHGYGWLIVAAASCSIFLILSGTGRWSVWKPEEPWITQPPTPSPLPKDSDRRKA